MDTLRQRIRACIDQLQGTSTDSLADVVGRFSAELLEESRRDDCLPCIEPMCELTEILKARVEKLEKNSELVADLEKTRREFDEIQCTLAAGQVAFELDKAVLKRVMEAIGRHDYEKLRIFNIFNMEKAINRKDNYQDILTEEESKRADRQWNDLKEKIGWENFHYRCLSMLKGSRTGIAHPQVDIQKMEEYLSKARLSEGEKKSCRELLEILKKLK